MVWPLDLFVSFSIKGKWKENRTHKKDHFLLCSFGLNQKNQKFKPKTNAPLFLAGQRTWTVIKDCKCIVSSKWQFAMIASCFSKFTEALTFSLTNFKDVDGLWQTKKKALVNVPSREKEKRINYFSESISNASCNSSSLPDKTSRRSPAINLSAPVGWIYWSFLFINVI